MGDPSDIVLLLYCRNMILPNDKLGRIWITPSQLIEGKTSTEWFSLNTFGEVKLNILSFLILFSSTLPLPLSREKEVTSLTFDKASHSHHRSLPHSSFHFRATSASHPTTTTYLMLIMKSMSCFSFSSLQHLTFFLFLFSFSK